MELQKATMSLYREAAVVLSDIDTAKERRWTVADRVSPIPPCHPFRFLLGYVGFGCIIRFMTRSSPVCGPPKYAGGLTCLAKAKCDT